MESGLQLWRPRVFINSSRSQSINNRAKYQYLCSLVEETYPILAPTWQLAFSRFGDEWLNDFIVVVERIFGAIHASPTQGLRDAIDGYAEFCNDSLRNQSFYERNGRYKASSYAECVENYYSNADHMNRCYLPGMWLSHYLWPQHYNMLHGFRHGILRRIGQPVSFFEVGVGCGMYSKVTLEQFPGVSGAGFDISAHSLAFTHKMADLFGHGDRYRTFQMDIRNAGAEKCEFLICQEVLEHLENPEEFCTWLFRMVKPGGFAYITAALNAAHSDHIFHFRDPLQLEQMLRAAGFTPLGLQEEFAAGAKPRATTPSLAGYFCQRQ
jgi:SAM-dependent methyltransferase